MGALYITGGSQSNVKGIERERIGPTTISPARK